MDAGTYLWLEEKDPEETAIFGDYSAIRSNYLIGDLLTPEFTRGLQALDDLGFVYDFNSIWERMAGARQAANLFPGLQFILGHAGMPLERTEDYFNRWRSAMADLAQAPNMAVKISGLGMTDHDWTVESIRPWVMAAIEIFGVERCMFASNWPVDSLYSDYGAVVDAYRRIVADFSDSERDALFWRNAEQYHKSRAVL